MSIATPHAFYVLPTFLERVKQLWSTKTILQVHEKNYYEMVRQFGSTETILVMFIIVPFREQ